VAVHAPGVLCDAHLSVSPVDIPISSRFLLLHILHIMVQRAVYTHVRHHRGARSTLFLSTLFPLALARACIKRPRLSAHITSVTGKRYIFK
jgi:hypothetical protein